MQQKGCHSARNFNLVNLPWLFGVVTIGEEAFGAQTSLAWVLVWANSKPDIKGPGLDQAEKEKRAASMSCVFVMIVDATTNEVLDSRQICR
jgi:hypothetical protein